MFGLHVGVRTVYSDGLREDDGATVWRAEGLRVELQSFGTDQRAAEKLASNLYLLTSDIFHIPLRSEGKQRG